MNETVTHYHAVNSTEVENLMSELTKSPIVTSAQNTSGRNKGNLIHHNPKAFYVCRYPDPSLFNRPAIDLVL
jgi:hypothetical protein